MLSILQQHLRLKTGRHLLLTCDSVQCSTIHRLIQDPVHQLAGQLDQMLTLSQGCIQRNMQPSRGARHTCLGSATEPASVGMCVRDASAACSTVSRMGPSKGRHRGPSAETHSATATTALLRTAACSSCSPILACELLQMVACHQDSSRCRRDEQCFVHRLS